MKPCADLGCPCQAPSPFASALALHAAAETRALASAEPELFPVAQQWSAYTGMTLAESVTHLRSVRDSFRAAIRQLGEAITATGGQMQQLLGAAGQPGEEPPADPRARALWARRNRSTGPPRPAAGHSRRPRNHPGNTDSKGA